MPICYIYHSESGHTRTVAERCAAALGGDLIEVKDLNHYNRFTRYLVGSFRARLERQDPIEPKTIDVSGYDTIVIGSPIWAGKPTPAIDSAIKALQGAEGKKGVVYVTCGSTPGIGLELLKRWALARGVDVRETYAITEREIQQEEKVSGLIDLIRRVSSVPAPVSTASAS
ncbi:MAG TPA: ArsR family transcriptional regulator [Methanomicrobiales archaeon]|nr:ArsR family transcriptional regulator [Methanomicrobiales archaeon]